jgi:hypothetical protein
LRALHGAQNRVLHIHICASDDLYGWFISSVLAATLLTRPNSTQNQ